MALGIVLAAPVVGMGIGSYFALSAIGSDILNIPEWSWVSFSSSIFLATAALLYSNKARKLSKALLIYPAVLSSIGAFGIIDGMVDGSASGRMVEVMDTLARIAGAGLIGVFPLLMSIFLLLEAWPEIAPKQLSQKNANK